MGLCGLGRRRRVRDAAAAAPLAPSASSAAEPSVLASYMLPGEATSCGRFAALTALIVGSFMLWLGPALAVVLADPMLQLVTHEAAVLTPRTPCLDPAPESQHCDPGVRVEYYLFNVTNAAEWAAGAAPPALAEVGPFAFRSREVRYNVSFSADWGEVAYSFHQWQELDAAASCAACTLGAPITGVNRGYLQFLAAGRAAAAAGGPDPETAAILSMTPLVLAVARGAVADFVRGALALLAPGLAGEPLEAAVAQAGLAQWADCGWLASLAGAPGLPSPLSPFLADFVLPPAVPASPFAGMPPELCASISAAAAAAGAPLAPADFAAAGLALDYGAAAAFLAAATGGSNATYLDPAAAGFVSAFLDPRLGRDGLLAALAAGPATAPLAAALAPVTPAQWAALQAYLLGLVPTWGRAVYAGWLAAAGGGLVVTKTVAEWLYGFTDPLLAAAAAAQAAAAGVPGAQLLSPHLFTPFIGLAFPSADAPRQYFSAVTGRPFRHSDLTWDAAAAAASGGALAFHPLVQQKRLATGAARGTRPQAALQYRGQRFFPRAQGILNVTGAAEGVALGLLVDRAARHATYDSVLGRAVDAGFTGREVRVAGVPALEFGLSPRSTQACNLSEWAAWAEATGFDPDDYASSLLARPDLARLLTAPDAELAAALAGTPLGGLGRAFGALDVGRDRCAAPDMLAGVWDMSPGLACPALFTLPHFLGADPAAAAATGRPAAWAPDPAAHGYRFAVEPATGYAIQGHKTYQVTHLASRTPHLAPALAVVPGSGAASGGALDDFVAVPAFWVRMSWAPSAADAAALRAVGVGRGVADAVLLFAAPLTGLLLLLPAAYALSASRGARARHAALHGKGGPLESRAPPTRLARAERDAVEGLERGGGAGGQRVLLREPRGSFGQGSSHGSRSSNDEEGALSPRAPPPPQPPRPAAAPLPAYARPTASSQDKAAAAAAAKPPPPPPPQQQQRWRPIAPASAPAAMPGADEARPLAPGADSGADV